MEEIARQLNEIFRKTEEIEKQLDNDAEVSVCLLKFARHFIVILWFQEIISKMNDLLFAKSADSHNKTPQQIKKKKRLTAILDTDDEEEIFLQRKSKSKSPTASNSKPGRPSRLAKIKAESFLVSVLIGFSRCFAISLNFL